MQDCAGLYWPLWPEAVAHQTMSQETSATAEAHSLSTLLQFWESKPDVFLSIVIILNLEDFSSLVLDKKKNAQILLTASLLC